MTSTSENQTLIFDAIRHLPTGFPSMDCFQRDYDQWRRWPRLIYRGDEVDYGGEEAARQMILKTLHEDDFMDYLPFDNGPQEWEADYKECLPKSRGWWKGDVD